MLEEVDIIQCREILDSKHAILIRESNDSSVSLVGDSEINRGWELSVPDYASNMREFLETYTDVINTSAKKYVDDPVASNEKFSGRWRLAFVRRIRRTNPEGIEVDYIVQTLRKGYIETLGSGTAIDYSEARLIDSRDLPAGTEATLAGGNTTENYITLQWNNVSPYEIETIKTYINGLNADTFSPTVRGDSTGSNWHRMYTVSKIEEDGSATLALSLAKPEFALKSYVEYGTANGSDVDYIWNCPKTLAQGVITAARATGKTCTLSYNVQAGNVDITIRTKSTTPEIVIGSLSTSNCQIKDYSSMYLGVYDPNLYQIPSASTQGVTYNRDINSNKDGTYDIEVTTRVVAEKVVGPFTSISSAFRKQETLQYRNYQTLIDAPEITGTGIYRLSQSPNQDCTYDADMTYEHGTNTGVFTFESLETLLSESTTSLYRDYEAYVNVPEAPQGAIYRASNSLTEDGLYNSELEYIRSKEFYVAFDRSISSLNSASEESYENYKAIQAIPATATQGTVVQDNLRINQDGTYTQNVVKQTSVPVDMEHKIVNNAHGEVYQYSYQNYRTVPDLPADSLGVVYDMSLSGMNEDGTYNASIRESVSLKDYDGAVITSNGTSDYIYKAINVSPDNVDEIVNYYGGTFPNNNNSVDITLNPDGTRNVSIRSNASGGGVDFERNFYWTQYVVRCEAQLPQVDKYKYLVYVNHKYSYSLTGLQNWISAYSKRFEGTSLRYIGKGKWGAVLVTTEQAV